MIIDSCKVIKIMGIVNVNDDSFFSGSRVASVDEFCRRVERFLEEGADIIDIGACSSRPGSVYEGFDTEWARLSPVLKAVAFKYPSVSFSIDTFSAEILSRAYDTIGRFIVNDISAGEDDEAMLPTVGALGLEYVAMHKRGLPADMSSLCQYTDVVADVVEYFKEFERKAAGFGICNWILDPGFGFAKTVEQSHQMLRRLGEFKGFNRPILVGISRKGLVYKPLGLTPETCLEETARLHRIAVDAGADILRVHDVGYTIRSLTAGAS